MRPENLIQRQRQYTAFPLGASGQEAAYAASGLQNGGAGGDSQSERFVSYIAARTIGDVKRR